MINEAYENKYAFNALEIKWFPLDDSGSFFYGSGLTTIQLPAVLHRPLTASG